MFFYKDNKLLRYIGVVGSPPVLRGAPPPRNRGSFDMGGIVPERACPFFWLFPTAIRTRMHMPMTYARTPSPIPRIPYAHPLPPRSAPAPAVALCP
jgi:hypothetical protein